VAQEETLRDIINRDPYNVYPNVRGHSLSYGEIKDWNDFQAWIADTTPTFSQESGNYKAHFGFGANEVGAEVKSVPDPNNPDRGLLQIVIGERELVETAYTLTGHGLLIQTLLPSEKQHFSQRIHGRHAGILLQNLKANLHP